MKDALPNLPTGYDDPAIIQLAPQGGQCPGGQQMGQTSRIRPQHSCNKLSIDDEQR